MSEMLPIFELFKKTKLTISRIPELASASDSEINEVVAGIAHTLPSRTQSTIGSSPFSFIASTQMSGGPAACSQLDCRYKAAQNLAYSSVLYADQVIIHNPFHEYAEQTTYNDFQRYNIVNDINLLFLFQPLLEAGIVIYADQGYHFCNNCYRKFMEKFDPDFEKTLNKRKSNLVKMIIDQAKFYVVDSLGEPALLTSNLDGIANHDIVFRFEKKPEILKKKYKPDKTIKISKSEVKASKMYQTLSTMILEDWYFQDYYSKFYDVSILTERPLDFAILPSGKSLINDKSNYSFRLDHNIPLIAKVPLKKLVEFRKKEGESFEVYRDAITAAIKESTNGLNHRKEVFDDIIRPELNKINATVKRSKKLLFGNIKQDLLLGLCSVGIGFSEGIMPNNIANIVSVMGGITYLDKLTTSVRGLLKSPMTSVQILITLFGELIR